MRTSYAPAIQRRAAGATDRKRSFAGGNPIKYKWTTSDGTIIGEGPVVTWNLAG
jgi:hypothetical protein